MSTLVKQLFRYYQSSIADVSRMAVDLTGQCNPTQAEIILGQISLDVAKVLFKQNEAQIKTAKEGKPGEDDLAKQINVTVVPFIASAKASHGEKSAFFGVRPLICIPAILKDDGTLHPQQEGMTIPWIPRNMLHPSTGESLVIGTLDDSDHFLSTSHYAPKTWTQVVQFAKELLLAVAGDINSSKQFVLVTGEHEAEVVLAKDTSDFTRSLMKLYQHLSITGYVSPLLERLSKGAPNTVAPLNVFETASRHIGSMSKQYGLAWSQRVASVHVALQGPGEVIAVNGPPGTGKTTLLAALIADSLSTAAVRKDLYPPITVVASTNNKAVINVNDSLGTVAADHERWISDVPSLGLYLFKAKSNTPPSILAYQRYDGWGGFFAEHIETVEWLNTNKTLYLSKASAFFRETQKDIDTAIDRIHQHLLRLTEKLSSESSLIAILSRSVGNLTHSVAERLREARDAQRDAFTEKTNHLFAEKLETSVKIAQQENERDAINQLIADTAIEENALSAVSKDLKEINRKWLKHKLGRSIIKSALSFLPFVQRRIDDEDAHFWSEHECSESKLASRVKRIEQQQLSMKQKKLELRETLEKAGLDLNSTYEAAAYTEDRISREIEENEEALTLLAQLEDEIKKRQWQQLTLTECSEKLDKEIRAEIFGSALHYWEGRYLIELKKKLADPNYDDDKSSAEKKTRMLRRFAMLTPCFVSTFNSLPNFFSTRNEARPYLLGDIDLLIAEEAGQIAPEIAFANFSFAKRVVAVGDIFQLEPVWNLPATVDKANARKYLSLGEDDLAKTNDNGYLTSTGCVMKVAQNACLYLESENRPKGFTLTEHRRCVPSIINYCNDLVYGGILEPKRPESASKVNGYLPSMGWAHIAGESTSEGGSRNNLSEADAITDWVLRNKSQLESHYPELDGLGSILAIVTPFSSQAALISQRLGKLLGSKHGITIGTVHSLQGAERSVVIFSPTYGINHAGGIYFDRSNNMMNVAVSRAKDSFLTFGNMNLFNPTSGGPLGLLAKYIFSSPDNNVTDVFPALRSTKGSRLATKDTERLSGRDDHLARIVSMFSEASERIVLASPYVTKSAIAFNDYELLKTVGGAAGRGIDVTIYLDKVNFHKAMLDGRMDIDSISKVAATGAKLFFTEKPFHNKTFVRDNHSLIEGSFNWLSAPRYASGNKHECSTAYQGEAVSDWIAQFLGEMQLLSVVPYHQ